MKINIFLWQKFLELSLHKQHKFLVKNVYGAAHREHSHYQANSLGPFDKHKRKNKESFGWNHILERISLMSLTSAGTAVKYLKYHMFKNQVLENIFYIVFL